MKVVSVIEPKNKEQEQAIEAGRKFLDKGKPDEWFVIVGKAGTGKTTIVQAILKGHVEKSKILVCALSHKAKLVIAEKLAEAFGDSSIISKSVAGALGMNMDEETGKFEFKIGAGEPPIRTAKIIIVDEASMINEESHQLIMTHKKKLAKVIYLGDIRQLPPIRERSSEDADKPSPVFYTENRAVLHERIRQGEESPILPFADFFGDNSRLKFPKLNPVPKTHRKNIVTEKGALVFANNSDDVIEIVLPLYKCAVDNKNMNVIKTITYRNTMRRRMNTAVREYVFGFELAEQQFVTGDLLMFFDNYNLDGFEEPISNSFEIQVLSVESGEDGGYKVWDVGFIYEGKPANILALDVSEVERHANDVSLKFEKAKKLPFGTAERSDALAAAWRLKKRYAPVEYAYAITSHKSQGSTYNTVVVDEMDIMSVRLASNKAKSQSMYTAVTRASTTCIVIDGQPADETLQQAVDLSFKKLIDYDNNRFDKAK